MRGRLCHGVLLLSLLALSQCRTVSPGGASVAERKRALDEALAKEPGRAFPLLADLVEAQRLEGEWKEGLRTLEEFLLIHPGARPAPVDSDGLDAQIDGAREMERDGQRELARERYSKALEAHTARARYLTSDQKSALAPTITLARRRLELLEAHDLARDGALLRRLDEADDQYEEATQGLYDFQGVHRLDHDLSGLQEAEEALARLVREEPQSQYADDAAFLRLCCTMHQEWRPKAVFRRAIMDMEDFLRTYPRSPKRDEVLFLLARLHLMAAFGLPGEAGALRPGHMSHVVAAKEHVGDLVDDYPDSYLADDALILGARALEQVGNLEEAFRAYQGVLEAEEGDCAVEAVQSRQRVAQAMGRQMGQHEEFYRSYVRSEGLGPLFLAASGQYQRLMGEYPDHGLVRSSYFGLHRPPGDQEVARANVELMRSFLVAFPASERAWEAHRNLAASLYVLADRAGAGLAVRKSVELAPDGQSALGAVGALVDAGASITLVSGAYLAAFERFPVAAEGRVALLRSLGKGMNPEELQAVAARVASRLGPGMAPETGYALTRAFLEQGLDDQARALGQRLGLRDLDLALLRQGADGALRRGDMELASRRYGELAEREPLGLAGVGMRRKAARAHREAGRWAEALHLMQEEGGFWGPRSKWMLEVEVPVEELARYIEVYPSDAIVAEATFTLGHRHQQEGRFARALEVYRRFVASYPQGRWMEQALSRIQALESVLVPAEELLGKGGEARVEGLYSLGRFYYHNRHFNYHPMWAGKLYETLGLATVYYACVPEDDPIFANFPDEGALGWVFDPYFPESPEAAPGEGGLDLGRAEMERYFKVEEGYQRAMDYFDTVIEEEGSAHLKAEAMYSAATARLRLSELNGFWRKRRAALVAEAVSLLQQVGASFPGSTLADDGAYWALQITTAPGSPERASRLRDLVWHFRQGDMLPRMEAELAAFQGREMKLPEEAPVAPTLVLPPMSVPVR